MKNKPLKKGDIIIILVLVSVSALLLLLPKGKADTAVITRDGETIATVDLGKVTQGYDMTYDGGIVIRVEKNAIGFTASSCANKLCVHTGMLTKAGDIAVCLPNKMLIRIKGKPAADAMTG